MRAFHKIKLFHKAYCEMPTEYAEAFSSTYDISTDFSFWLIYT